MTDFRDLLKVFVVLTNRLPERLRGVFQIEDRSSRLLGPHIQQQCPTTVHISERDRFSNLYSPILTINIVFVLPDIKLIFDPTYYSHVSTSATPTGIKAIHNLK